MGSNVDMPFDAEHANGFASYDFSVKSGGDQVVSNTANVPFLSVTTTAQKTVSNLLDGCEVTGCYQALHARAKVTNGWNRQNQYDELVYRAFVRTKK
jgi:uncharacterized protein YvpB